VPMTRSQIASALGLCGGDFNTLTPSRPIDSSDPPPQMQHNIAPTLRHRLREDVIVRARSILGGLHPSISGRQPALTETCGLQWSTEPFTLFFSGDAHQPRARW
jgi:hypothetical protein